jgi:hypothetical protein
VVEPFRHVFQGLSNSSADGPVPYHPNVSAEGKILFGLVDRGYCGTLRVTDLLMGVYALLSRPEENLVLRPAIWRQFTEDRAGYEREAMELAATEAKESVEEYEYFGGAARQVADFSTVFGPCSAIDELLQ